MVKFNRSMRAALLAGASTMVWLKCLGAVWAQESLPDILIGSPQQSAAPAGQADAPAGQSGADFSYSGGPLIDPAQSPEPNPVSSVTPEGIRILGGPAQASSYKPLDLMPSVIEDSADPYGLSFTRSITVRGVSDFFLSRTIDGLPIAGIVGGADLIDLSNLSRIDLYRGSLQANQGLGFASAAGQLDQIMLPPKAEYGGWISQGAGSDGFWRTAARVDSGLLPTGTAFFVSGSWTEANKWKGDGDASRKNVMFGLSQKLGDNIDVKVYGVHNDQKAYSYLPLTYAQTTMLSAYAWADYNTQFTGKPKVDNNSYLFNKTRYADNAIWTEITYKMEGDQSFVLKPYYWRNEGSQLTTSGTGVKLWPINNYTLGGVAEYRKRFSWGGDLLLGYWGEDAKPEPPPLGQQQFNVTSVGTLSYANWSVLAKSTDHEFYSPFMQYTQSYNATTVSGGVRLLVEGAPALQYYTTTGLPQVSYTDVFAYAPRPDPNAAVAARTFTDWLPNLGFRQQLSNEWSLNASYSRKTGRPDWGPQASSFTGAEAAFLKRGINMQTLMSKIRPELVDEIDFGVRYQSGDLTIIPTFFGFTTHKKEVLVYDPNVGQSYYQSNAATNGYGFEIEAIYKASDHVTLNGTFTDASETYKSNIATGTNTLMYIAGKQVPYTPTIQAKGAVTWHDYGFEITPSIRYVSTRYGLADDTQAVSPYAVVDLNASYDLGARLGLKAMRLNAGILNLTDRRYIGAISVNEDNLNSTSYYVAPPRTIFAGITANF
ncbi:TonB-dependent receptor [Methylocystis heyeri]|uniref:TonB-dependent receptor plug domain-containing protein n=1 Tax=Methylocystis heyeri TaxID=391905 RepID=A0A6B8KCS0_9HYPH|nr:TonB-dependent receptor [Methylocystis heyeri]QGM46214.1 TonB-dependent receptor plug domain-containing protein [Methylocystis heyeri]